MRRRVTAKDVVIDMLREWGEWESEGRYQAAALRSTVGTLVTQGPGSGGTPAGSRIPAGVMIPAQVQEINRLMASMRENCRAGDRYCKVIRARYVLGEATTGPTIERAIRWLAAAWLESRPWSAAVPPDFEKPVYRKIAAAP